MSNAICIIVVMLLVILVIGVTTKRDPKLYDIMHAQTDCVMFDIWDLIHLVGYAIVGMVLPGHLLLIGVFSVAFEAYDHNQPLPEFYGNDPTYRWRKPVENIVGYAIGSEMRRTIC